MLNPLLIKGISPFVCHLLADKWKVCDRQTFKGFGCVESILTSFPFGLYQFSILLIKVLVLLIDKCLSTLGSLGKALLDLVEKLFVIDKIGLFQSLLLFLICEHLSNLLVSKSKLLFGSVASDIIANRVDHLLSKTF